MANDISKYHGEVSVCECGLYEKVKGENAVIPHPEKQSLRACGHCFGRGFLAQCKACNGKGQVEQDMAGGPGKMSSTCIPCGGKGSLGVKQPADWKTAKAAAEKQEEPAVA